MTDVDIRCPSCDYSPVEEGRYASGTDMPRTREEALDCFEVGGADDGCVFCPMCSCEFNPDTGEQPTDESWLEKGLSL